jgi:hypothetical protein
MTEIHGVDTDLLVRIDSVCSLVGYRYTRGIPDDIVRELRDLSQQVRDIYNPRPGRNA